MNSIELSQEGVGRSGFVKSVMDIAAPFRDFLDVNCSRRPHSDSFCLSVTLFSQSDAIGRIADYQSGRLSESLSQCVTICQSVWQTLNLSVSVIRSVRLS